MFWGIDRPEWFLLWSGILGAVVSAAVAAFVASMVLSISNRHQIKLSEESAEKQRELVRMQLDEQRADAARSRQQAALAEVLMATEGLALDLTSKERIRANVSALNAALARWRVELGGGEMERELMRWPRFLRGVAFKVIAGRAAGSADWRGEYKKLRSALGELSSVVLAWQSADDESRTELHEGLQKFRREISAGKILSEKS